MDVCVEVVVGCWTLCLCCCVEVVVLMECVCVVFVLVVLMESWTWCFCCCVEVVYVSSLDGHLHWKHFQVVSLCCFIFGNSFSCLPIPYLGLGELYLAVSCSLLCLEKG